MKLLKRKNFQSLIYAIFISLPILSLLPSTIYFAFNHNAQEYTQNEALVSYEYETNEVNSVSDLVDGNIYHLELTNYELLNYNNFQLNHYGLFNITFNAVNGIQFTSSNNVSLIANLSSGLFLVTDNYYNVPITQQIYGYRNVVANDTINLECDFLYMNSGSVYINKIINNISASDYLGEKNVEVIESDMNPLTAFDNAIDKFVSENDFGRIDFFTFFSSLFLTPTSMNNLYVHFINWYLNYILYISLAYLLFSVLLWFVNFGRRLLEDSQNINVGGF